MFEYTISKSPNNSLDSHSIYWGPTGVVWAKVTKSSVFDLHLTHMKLKTKVRR